MSDEKIIHEFVKNSAEKVVPSTTVYKGKELVNLHVYYNSTDEGEDWRLSPKDSTLWRKLIAGLMEAIDKIVEEYESELPGEGNAGVVLDEAVDGGSEIEDAKEESG